MKAIFIMLVLAGASSAWAESFECSDYFGKTTLSVTYNYSNANTKQVNGQFELKSLSLTSGEISGAFFNYAGEPDKYALNVVDCSEEKEKGYCVQSSGNWLAAARGYKLTFGGSANRVDALVTCHGELP